MDVLITDMNNISTTIKEKKHIEKKHLITKPSNIAENIFNNKIMKIKAFLVNKNRCLFWTGYNNKITNENDYFYKFLQNKKNKKIMQLATDEDIKYKIPYDTYGFNFTPKYITMYKQGEPCVDYYNVKVELHLKIIEYDYTNDGKKRVTGMNITVYRVDIL